MPFLRREMKMAKRHVINYCSKINNYYTEFLNEVKELEQLCAEYAVSPDTIEQMKSIFEPLKTMWTNSNYYLYLLKKGKSAAIRWYNDSKRELTESATDLDDAKTTNSPQLIIDNLQTIYETSYQKYRSAVWFIYLVDFPNRKRKEQWYIKNASVDLWNPFTYINVDGICKKSISEIKKLNYGISHKES